jgi:hypothetical protein
MKKNTNDLESLKKAAKRVMILLLLLSIATTVISSPPRKERKMQSSRKYIVVDVDMDAIPGTSYISGGVDVDLSGEVKRVKLISVVGGLTTFPDLSNENITHSVGVTAISATLTNASGSASIGDILTNKLGQRIPITESQSKWDQGITINSKVNLNITVEITLDHPVSIEESVTYSAVLEFELY